MILGGYITGRVVLTRLYMVTIVVSLVVKECDHNHKCCVASLVMFLNCRYLIVYIPLKLEDL